MIADFFKINHDKILRLPTPTQITVQFSTHLRHLLIFSTSLSMRPPMCKSPFTLSLNFMDSSPSFWSTCTDSSHDVSPYSAAVIMALLLKKQRWDSAEIIDRMLQALDIVITGANTYRTVISNKLHCGGIPLTYVDFFNCFLLFGRLRNIWDKNMSQRSFSTSCGNIQINLASS